MAMSESNSTQSQRKSFSTDSDLRVAILIPTLNRRDFLLRTLKYYESVQSGHIIYIGDASGDENAEAIEEIVLRLSIQVRYFSWPNLGTNSTITRLAQEASLDRIKFCAVQGDDEFLIPDSLWRASKFLSENPDYRTAQGRAALFTLDAEGAYGNINVLGDYWGKPELTDDSPVHRFRRFSHGYFVLQFATHRISEFLLASTIYNEIRNDMLGELTHCYTFAILGRAKFIECLYLVRHSHPGAKHPMLVDRVLERTWSDDLEKMFSSISEVLSNSRLIDVTGARKEVEALFNDYFASLAKRQYSRTSRIYRLNSVSASLVHRIKRYVGRIFCDRRSQSCLDCKRSHYYSDFRPIMKVLTNEKTESSHYNDTFYR